MKTLSENRHQTCTGLPSAVPFWFGLFITIAFWMPSSTAQAVGFRPTVVLKPIQAEDSKRGIEEYTNAAPPLIKKYLTETLRTEVILSQTNFFDQTNSYSWDDSPAGCCGFSYGPGQYGDGFTYIYDVSRIISYDPNTPSTYTETYSGSATTSDTSFDSRTFSKSCGGCSGNGALVRTNTASFLSGTEILTDDCWVSTWESGTTNQYESCTFPSGCSTNEYSPPYTSTNCVPPLIYVTFGNETRTPTVLTYEAFPLDGLETSTYTLTDEYSTSTLMDSVRAKLPAYGNWETASADGPAMAWRYADCTERNGYEGKAKVKLSFLTKRGFPYVVKYKLLEASWHYVNDCTNLVATTNIVVKRISKAGTGGVVEIELPELTVESWNNSKVASKFWVFTPRRGLPAGATGYDEDAPGFGAPPQNWDEFDEDDVPDDEAGDDDGNDDDDGGGPPQPPQPPQPPDEDDCGSCSEGSCDSELGSSSLSAASGAAQVSFGLGASEDGETAGQLSFQSAAGGADASPAGLTLNAYREDVEVVMQGERIRQVKAPQGLADVITNSASEFQIKFYPNSAVLPKVSGVYQLTGSPVATHIISSLGLPAYKTNTTVVTIRDGNYTTNRIHAGRTVWEGGGPLWTSISYQNGLRTNRTTTEWDDSVTPPARIVRHEKYDPGSGALLRANMIRYEEDSAGDEMVASRQSVAGSETRILTREYYPDDTAPGYPDRLKKRIAPDGQWSYYEYDVKGRVVREFSGFLNQGYTTDSNLCRVVTKDYTQLPPEGSDSYSSTDVATPRMEVEYLLGKEIRRTYRVELAFESRSIICQTPGAAWDAADNLVTITKLNSSGDWAGQLASVENPDGTMSFYAYATNSAGFHTNTVTSGLPNGGKTDITKGTRTTTVIDPAGQTLATTTVDVASTITTDQTIFSDPDSVGRYRKVTYLDNTFTWTGYGCCGVETVTNRDGSVTSYDYDSLGRKFMQSTDGITKFNYYDSAGRLYSVIRQGTNGNQITLFSRSFDAWGRVLRETNAMLNVTSWAYLTNTATGGNLVIQTNADGGTIIKTYAINGTLLKTTGTGVHPVRTDYGVEQDAGVWRAYSKEIKLDAAFADTSEWVKHYSDLVARSYKTVFPDGATNVSYFNAQGELWKQVDPDGVITLVTNLNFNESYSVVDMDQDSAIDWSGPDRISKSVTDFTASSLMGGNVFRTRSYVYVSAGSSAETLLGTSETSVDGLKQWSVASGVTNKSQTVYATGGYQYVTNTAPDGAYTVSVSQKGRQLSVTQRDALNTQLSVTTYGYDAHGRMATLTDARNGTTTFTFNNGDQIVTTTTPVPGAGQSAQVTTSYYDSMDRPWKTVLPDAGLVTNDFHLAGETRTTFGARLYASGNGYDVQGRLKTLTNWSGFPSTGTRKTTWNYDSQRGFLTSKVYPDGIGPAYGYTSAGRFKTRLWARSVNTTNSYNAAGDLSGIGYNDSTAAVGMGFDRRGKTTSVTNGATVITSALNDVGLLLADSFAGGVMSGLSVTNGYDALLRRTNLTLNTPLSTLNTTYGYDSASRLSTVRAGTNSATYSYVANSPLVSHVLYTNGSALRMTRTNQYDNLNRLTNLLWKAGSTTVASFAYQYNNANQRTRATLADGSYWLYLYDSLGQVTSSKKYWSDGTPVAGQQSTYDFDDIGNRKSAASGGDQFGNNLHSATYGANLLNQYTNRTVPGYVNILGSATNTATVTVNNQATYRRSNYFRAELLVTNASAAIWLSATNLAVLSNGTNADIVASTIGNVYVPQTLEAFAYDADGNLTNDGRWSYTWDAENRATSFTRNSSAPSGSKVKLDCQYDYRSRRTQKIVSTWNGSAYLAQSTNKFVYDGWNLVAILDSTNGLVQSFSWGTDASGSMQGAGGVGGLISMTVHQGTNAGTYFYCFDGNHNVATLVNATNGVVEAVYELDAFLGILRATGRLAFVNPFVGSTKFCDWETGFLYYGYRYYDPFAGRWSNRDPIQDYWFMTMLVRSPFEMLIDSLEDELGKPCYTMLGNHPTDLVDCYGLWPTKKVSLFGIGVKVVPHQASIDRVLSSLPAKDRGIMKDMQVHADEDQSTDASYKHAMRSPSETVATAKKRANEYVKCELEKAKKAEKRGKHDLALIHVGLAMHVLQDATSPAHSGFQVWHGMDHKLEGLKHVRAENYDPGSGSTLDKATQSVWDYFTGKIPLPDDFFK